MPQHRRREYLDEACANDAALRDEVDSLVAAHEASGGFIEGSAADVAAALLGRESLRGRSVAQFAAGELIGRGGMGDVYAATDRMGRGVALKVLTPRLVRDRQHVARFMREARAVLALNHPNIVTVYDIGEADGTYYIASELIEGETLREVLDRRRLPPPEAVDIAIQVCSALAAAHDKGIVHRDIKPENVMLRADGYVKVLDFGIAKLTQDFRGPGAAADASHSRATVAGLIVGTTPYMSPEQARGTAVDARSDVWSCGVLLYEMLTGQGPFAGGGTTDVLARILEREPQPLAELTGDVPAGLQDIVSRTLKKAPGERYASIAELLADLKSLRQELEFGEKIRTLHATGESPPAAPARRRRLALAAGVVALAAAAAWLGRTLLSPDLESVAVLPFVNATGDPALEYLSDGVTESLINALGRLPNLSVKSRGMVFRYKGRDADPRQVASELSVQAVLYGRIERRGDRLLLAVALARGKDGDHLWGERYDSTMTDLAAIQGGMARDIAARLQSRLSGTDERRVGTAETASGQAYQLYLKGRYHVQKVALPEVQAGIRYLEEATALDPNYALAYVGLADAYRTASAADIEPALVVPKAKRAAERAVQIDPNLSVAHTQLGILAIWYDWDPQAAERHFLRALELNRDDADAHVFLAHLRSNQGRHDEAIREAERALELEPFNARFNALTGQFLVHAGRADEAITKLRAALQLDPNHVLSRMFLATAYIDKRMFPEAIVEAQAAVDSTRRRVGHPLGVLAYALARSGRMAEARAILDELLTTANSRYVSPYSLALAFEGLGEHDQALSWLARGFEARDHKMNLMKVDPKWQDLHGDPRFESLVRRVGF